MQCARSAISKTPPLGAFVCAALLAGCGVTRPSDYFQICPSYEETIRPLVESRCAECHSPIRPGGGYVVGVHTLTVSRSDDGKARVAPGNLDSPFLAAARGERAGHPAIDPAEVAVLENWVGRCRAAPRPYQYHPEGWSSPTDPEQFHGVALRAQFYRFGECQECHGDDLRGGKSAVDCNSCHVKGPTDCSTCHGNETSAAPPRDLQGVRAITSLGVGAHRAHVTDGPAHKAYACTSCHIDVQNVEDEGHYRTRGVFKVGPAEVLLASGPGGTAAWDRTTATCTNSACHAASPNDTAATNQAPTWTRAGEVGCGSCHGYPPSSHSGDQRCQSCHGAAYADGGVDYALHLNGQVDLRNGGAGCDSCHSGPQSPAFVDLAGRTGDSSVKTVGAHDVHLTGTRLRGPLTCNECHLVPSVVNAPGHIDSAPPAEVFPVNEGGLAWAFNAMPIYDASNATCTNYCHGGGNFGVVDTSPNLVRNPLWTGGPAQAACGTCHGLPPQDGTQGHTVLATTIACNVCHGGTVSADGGLIFTTGADGGITSKHLDGLITGQ